MFARILSYLLIPALFFAVESVTQALEIEVPIIADTLLGGHSAENNTNCGARDRLRVKGYQGAVVFRFDMSELKDHRAESAIFSVYCAGISGDAQGKTSSEKISTIAHDWIEGIGDYTVSEDSATFLWPGKELGDTWGDDNNDGQSRYGPIDALDVINGNGDSILNSLGIWEFVVTEWTEIELDAELVQGLIDGDQYGIIVWRNSTGVNLDLASRENADGKFAARLVVTTSGVAVDVRGKLASTWGTLKSI